MSNVAIEVEFWLYEKTKALNFLQHTWRPKKVAYQIFRAMLGSKVFGPEVQDNLDGSNTALEIL